MCPDRSVDRHRRPLVDERARWDAVFSRDQSADGAFVYAVRTTGIFCKPSCPSRRAKRQNILFFASARAAQNAGFRACKRCRPLDETANEQTAIVLHACAMIDGAEQAPDLATLAAAAGLSRWHFQRLFKAQIGLTPKQYAVARRKQRLRETLTEGGSVTGAILDAGYQTNSRAYEDAKELGMAPRAYRSRGAGEVIRWCTGRSSLGDIVVAATPRGICLIEFGPPQDVVRKLETRFAKARIVPADDTMADLVAGVIRLIDDPSAGVSLPLDIRGTAFQEKVWRALTQIPPGATLSYGELAERLGKPGAARAVARACAGNPVAVAVPCHRVISRSGALAGYRWGVARKRALLDREGVRVPADADA